MNTTAWIVSNEASLKKRSVLDIAASVFRMRLIKYTKWMTSGEAEMHCHNDFIQFCFTKENLG